MTFSLSDTFKKTGALFFNKPTNHLKLGLAFGAAATAAYFVSSFTQNTAVGFSFGNIAGGVVMAALIVPMQISLLKQANADATAVRDGSKMDPKSSLFYGGLSELAKNYAHMALGCGASAAATTAAVMATQRFIIG